MNFRWAVASSSISCYAMPERKIFHVEIWLISNFGFHNIGRL